MMIASMPPLLRPEACGLQAADGGRRAAGGARDCNVQASSEAA